MMAVERSPFCPTCHELAFRGHACAAEWTIQEVGNHADDVAVTVRAHSARQAAEKWPTIVVAAQERLFGGAAIELLVTKVGEERGWRWTLHGVQVAGYSATPSTYSTSEVPCGL